MVANSIEIYNKIENFDLRHKQTIPRVKVQYYPKEHSSEECKKKYPYLVKLLESNDEYERYWVQQCLNSLKEKNLFNETYLTRLNEEADIKITIGQKLETNMFSYPITLQHYINLFWECGSVVGAGRGSSCSGLNHYLLGITQLDPIKWNLPFWRYLNKERTELGDIDLDLCPSKRPIILKRIKKERGENFNINIDDVSRQNLGCVLVATFGTESTKSAILTACRGYRSEDYPNGIDVDLAQYLTSLIPSERGFLWSLNDVVNGNPEKNRLPVKAFINEVNKYPRLLEIMVSIEGLVNKRSSHASGVILNDEDPYEFGCYMKTPTGDVITQWDLHMDEAAGMTKYDFLLTEIQDKIVQTIKLLQEDEKIDKNLTLRDVYNKYLHPDIIPIEDKEVWKNIRNNSILNLFQFDSDVGAQAVKKIQPTNITELSDANGLMRLMTSEHGQETPMDKYVRFKNNLSLWYQEMDRAGLTKEEQVILEPYFKSSYGVPPSQEQLMEMLMDENICNFSLAEANAARKIIGKKLMDKIPELRNKILSKARSQKLGNYVLRCGVAPQLGYSFSKIHALAYSFIGYQTAYLATRWNPIYWNTACLIVNSAAIDTEEYFDDAEYEDELVDKSTDYTKLAKAIGDITSRGIKVSLVDINKSSYSFKPVPEEDTILFGLKGVSKVGENVINQIIENRLYYSFFDFLNKVKLNRTVVISLIRAGAFDKLEMEWAKELKIEPRLLIMVLFLWKTSKPKEKVTLQNLSTLLKNDLIPDDLLFQKQLSYYNKHLKELKYSSYYILDDISVRFFEKHFDTDILESNQKGQLMLSCKAWEKIYNAQMDTLRNWIKVNHQEVLDKLNYISFKESWDKYGMEGNIAAWEMESLCFYYHDHELKNVNTSKYGIVNFFDLPTTPEPNFFFKKGERQIPIYKLYKIIGTIIGKNKTKSTVTLLTLNGVVTVKMTKEYYAMFSRQISEKQADGTKKIIEKSWFQRGIKIMITGFRRDDMFVAKRYKNTPGHTLYKIVKIEDNGDIELIHERAQNHEEEI